MIGFPFFVKPGMCGKKSVVIHPDQEKSISALENTADQFMRNLLLPEKMFNHFLAGDDI